jgi:hypothetical protein
MKNSPLVLAQNGPAKDATFREAISCVSISFSGYFLPERLLFALLETYFLWAACKNINGSFRQSFFLYSQACKPNQGAYPRGHRLALRAGRL